MFEFDWDEANLAHIAVHGVLQTEAEEVFRHATLAVDGETVGDEVRFVELGRTASGRILRIVTTERAGKIRIVTAFPAPQGIGVCFSNRPEVKSDQGTRVCHRNGRG